LQRSREAAVKVPLGARSFGTLFPVFLSAGGAKDLLLVYVAPVRRPRLGSLLPPELVGLFEADDPVAREAAWKTFVETYSRLLVHTARSLHRDYDAAMDAYAYLLEQLRRDDFRRLRAYTPDTRSKFTTWLVVVARRICVDLLRERYGRRVDGSESQEPRAVRRRLADLLVHELDPAAAPDTSTPNPETALRARELSQALTAALARFEPRDRLLLKLRYEDQLPAREIGHLLRFATPFHVYRRLNALLEALRTALQRRGIEGSEP
jgi:RNA polymerase sigma factor (sigma-70 family)